MKSSKSFARKERGLKITRLMARDGLDCALCGHALDRAVRDPEHRDYITFDHIQPQALAGVDEFSNVRLAHRGCNMLRGSTED